jgi:Alpha/beta hydrolase domain
MKITIATVLGLAAALASPAEARITEIRIERIQPFAGGMEFGDVGAYERVVGVAKGELDPADLRNRVIVNLDKAPKNARGRVEYQTEFYILRPVDASRGNRKILYEVNNRGRKFLLHWMLDAPAQAVAANNEPKDAKDAGNGLFFRQGYIMAWSGWDPDAPKSNNGMTIKVPVAMDRGQLIVRRIREELVSGTRAPLASSFRLSYEAATLEQSQARLSVRRGEADAKADVPESKWAYADAHTIKLLPEGTKPEPGSLYELRYPAKDPKVLGIGFAATRDFVSFLRYATSDANFTPNPAGRGIRAALALGISQSGRYLRDHIVQGYNQDENARRVFDGVLAHISGAGKLFLNTEFGEPARTNTQHEDHYYPENEFPFSAARMKDPISGKSGSLFRGDGFDPLLIEVNTSTEYWQKGASLLHTDPLGKHDVKLPANARVYMVAGTQHAGRAGLDTAPGPCENPRNPHNPAPALRALLVALDAWVSEGVAPPANRVPTIASGTLVAPDRTGFPKVPGARIASQASSMVLYGDWMDPKPDMTKAYRPLVTKVDRDGNEVAGIRLPDIAVPIATYTGWNLYRAPYTEGELCDRDGSYLAFARTKSEREAKGDPRLSLEERYAGQADYARQLLRAATDLVKERLLLQEDAEAYVLSAAKRGLLQ